MLKLVLSMEAVNNTIAVSFSASEAKVPLLVSYLKIIVFLLAPFVTGILSTLVIGVIAVERELHTNYYFFLVNVLVTDFFGVEKYLSYRNIYKEIQKYVSIKYRNI